MQGATMKSELEEIEKFVQLLKATPESYGIKHAFLVDSPIETAMTIIYQDCVKILRNVKVFSTYEAEAAVGWQSGEIERSARQAVGYKLIYMGA